MKINKIKEKILNLDEAAELIEHEIEYETNNQNINDLFEALQLVQRVLRKYKAGIFVD